MISGSEILLLRNPQVRGSSEGYGTECGYRLPMGISV